MCLCALACVVLVDVVCFGLLVLYVCVCVVCCFFLGCDACEIDFVELYVVLCAVLCVASLLKVCWL